MSNPYIKAAASNLKKAAAEKRQQKHNLENQANELKRQMAQEEKNKKHEIHEHEVILAIDPTLPTAAYSAKRIHDAREDFKKMDSMTKQKISSIDQEKRKLDDQARDLENESRSLEMKA